MARGVAGAQAGASKRPTGTAPQTAGPEAGRGEAVGPLERGLDVLRVMADSAEAVRPGDLVRATGLARSAVDRIAATLVHLGYLRAEGRDLVLAPRLMEFGNAYLDASGLSRALRPSLERLTRTLDESVSAIVLDGCDARIVGTAVPPGRVIPLGFRVGDLLPSERCAAGAVLATGWDPPTREAWRARRAADPLDAGFPAVPTRPTAPRPERTEADFASWTTAAAANGWALDDQLVAPGLVALAVPVRDPDGRPVCAISVLAHTSRHSADDLRAHALTEMNRAAQDIADALYGTSHPLPAAPPPIAAPAYTDAKPELGPSFLQALARGLAVLTALGGQRGGLTLAEAAEAAGLSYQSARRNLLTLSELSYVEQHERRFLPGPRVLELGYARLSTLTLADIARPHLADLVARVRESASLAVLDGAEVRYVARVATGQITSARITPGTRLPAYATSMGRVLLADLPRAQWPERIRSLRPQALTPHTLTSPEALTAAFDQAAHDGFALVEQELEAGLRSLAVPVRDRSGRAVAALNVAMHAGPESPEQTRDSMLSALRACAARVEADLALASAHVPVETG
ncbi:helix-turn-helix domain-containing protein [Streptomyces sp. RLB3-17]|uniref:IclR family transcriptional regulator domain-containing protein n=1 Tax=unclassified Streptomyces TaxID=2593676 RepID=UPI001161D0B4|nr:MULTISPECIES: IclR family transcriptional regulator C-terminal domain-containing protein [unclassified Streptomyces]QDO03262.1 helix-turn-helix domain-containing protein [Streptomyces sp. RLB1-9]QDO24994.1 helix-turn-helix domain-containing protein [Streptomyces sp. S1A1-8]QDO35115.1 helix-turn-helix domain-containing protein [Streptomyces sp. S1A1-3]QDO45129.1 helix-turn-helix domain-containing protein [Streptomyces sp. RLB3-17]